MPAAGMTLQQLYSAPYDPAPTSQGPGPSSSSSSGAMTTTSVSSSSNNNSSVTKRLPGLHGADDDGSSPRAPTPTTAKGDHPQGSPHGPESASSHLAHPPHHHHQQHQQQHRPTGYAAASEPHHHHHSQQQQPHHQHHQVTVQHYPQYNQLPPPHAYAQYQQHKADDYGLPAPAASAPGADPLPFQFMDIRKYHGETGKDLPEHRFAPAPGLMHSHAQAAYHEGYATPGSRYSPHQDPTTSVGAYGHPHPSQQQQDVGGRGGYHTTAAGDYSGATSSSTHVYGMTAPSAPHSFPPLIDPTGLQGVKKEEAPGAYGGSPLHPTAPSSSAPTAVAVVAPASSLGPHGGASQEAVIKVKTPLKTKYWRNGRRNLQCFPSCKVFGDYSAIKIEDLKQHDFMWGKCRGSIITEVTLNSSVLFDDILILGRVHSMENIPVAFEEAVIRECMLGRMVEPEVMDAMKDQWITGERLPDFVQQDGNTACYEFKPKVWKYTEDMSQGKCKRRNVKYYVQFEAFVLVMSGDRRYYACIGSGMSTAFEVGSSRVLARQKRKAAATGLELPPQDLKVGAASTGVPVATAAPTTVPELGMHPMMAAAPPPGAHGMMNAMFPTASTGYATGGYPNRGVLSGFPQQSHHQQHPHAVMNGGMHMPEAHHHHPQHQQHHHPHQHHQHQLPQAHYLGHQLVQPPPSELQNSTSTIPTGEKRKLSTGGGGNGSRSTKARKV